MSNVTSTLDIVLTNDVSKSAAEISASLEKLAAREKAVSTALNDSGLGNKLQDRLKRLGAEVPHIEAVTKQWQAFAKAQGIAVADRSTWTAAQAEGVKNWENVTVSSVRSVMSEERALAAQRVQQAAEQDRLVQKQATDRLRAVEMEQAALRRQTELEVREAHRVAEVRQHAIEKNGFKHYALGGVAAAVSAHSVAEVIKEGVDFGVEREHVLAGMKLAGMQPDEMARATALAAKTSKDAPNMSITELLELHREARSGVQHPEEAFDIMPDLGKAAGVLKGMGATNDNVADIVKGGESLGLMNDPKRFHAYLSGQIKAMQVMGKTITTEQVYEAAKYTKSAGATLSDEFLNTTMPSLIQELHGSSAGEALAAITKRWRGGLAHQHLAVQRLDQMGLLEDPSKIVRAKKSGEIMGYLGKLKDDDLLGSDPRRFFQEKWAPAAEAIGAKTLADKIKLLNETLPTVAANAGRVFLQQEETLKNHAQLYKAAPDLDQSVDIQRNDPKVAWQSFMASINDLASAASGPLIEQATKGLSALAGSVKALADAAKDNPLAATGTAVTAAAAALGVSGWASWKTVNGFLGRGGAAKAAAAAVEGGIPEFAAGGGLLPWLATAGPIGAVGAIVGGTMIYGSDVKKGLAFGGKPDAPMSYSFADEASGGGANEPARILRPADADERMAERDRAARQNAVPFSQGPARPGDMGLHSDEGVGNLRPTIDTSGLDAAKSKADETHAAIDGLNVTATPTISTASIDAYLGKLREAVALQGQLGAGGAGGRIPTGDTMRAFNNPKAGRLTT